MEMNQFELDKPCHISRNILEQSRDDYVIYLPPGNVTQAVGIAIA